MSTVQRKLSVALLCAGLASSSFAGDLDRYRYVLTKSADDKVCSHMRNVYDSHFATPWKRPALSRHANAPEYGPKSAYAFPRLEGVSHDSKATFYMSLSRAPTSAEFEAIPWREGRYRHERGDGSMLVADFDIDNDGNAETVVKLGFMVDYYVSRGTGGEDILLVHKRGELDLQQPLTQDLLWGNGEGRRRPAVITVLPGVPYRLIRPFVLGGVTYLSGYVQRRGKADRITEQMHVVRYRGVSANPDSRDSSNVVHLDRVCVFRMQVAH